MRNTDTTKLNFLHKTSHYSLFWDEFIDHINIYLQNFLCFDNFSMIYKIVFWIFWTKRFHSGPVCPPANFWNYWLKTHLNIIWRFIMYWSVVCSVIKITLHFQSVFFIFSYLTTWSLQRKNSGLIYSISKSMYFI